MASETKPTPKVVAVPCIGLRPREAAMALGISPRMLWSITTDRSSSIPYVRLSAKAIVYPVRELTNWLAERTGGGR